jgi:hypothetical protein
VDNQQPRSRLWESENPLTKQWTSYQEEPGLEFFWDTNVVVIADPASVTTSKISSERIVVGESNTLWTTSSSTKLRNTSTYTLQVSHPWYSDI